MKLGIKVFYFLLGLLIFIACAPRAEVPQPRSEDKTTVPQAPAKEAWEKAWNEIVREAQKEGTVVVYGIPIESREPFAKSLKEKFGLKMEILTGQGPVVGAKILSERRGGIFITDIFIAGPATPLVQLKPQGAFDSIEPELVLPEVKDPKSWRGGGIRFLDKDRLVVAASTFIQLTLAYNNSIINPEEIKSYSSLLNPRWKGKISISDATIAGPGWAWFGAMEEGIPGGKEFLRQVVKQEPAIIRDYRLQVEWLA